MHLLGYIGTFSHKYIMYFGHIPRKSQHLFIYSKNFSIMNEAVHTFGI